MGRLRNPSAPHSRHRPGLNSTSSNAIRLPAEGCTDPVPDMPPGRPWSDIERQRWEQLWTSPQATQWDESATGTVASLIIYEGAILAGTARAWQAEEARYAATELGLTPKAMLHMNWVVE